MIMPFLIVFPRDSLYPLFNWNFHCGNSDEPQHIPLAKVASLISNAQTGQDGTGQERFYPREGKLR